MDCKNIKVTPDGHHTWGDVIRMLKFAQVRLITEKTTLEGYLLSGHKSGLIRELIRREVESLGACSQEISLVLQDIDFEKEQNAQS